MAGPSVINGDLRVRGLFTAESMELPAASVRNASVAPDAAIDASKCVQQYVFTHKQNGNVAVATDRLHVAIDDGILQGARVEIRAAPAAANSFTVDLKVNGLSILSSPLTIDHSTAVDTPLDLDIATPEYLANNRIDVVIAAVAGTSFGSGLYVQATTREGPG
ncbi:MAG: hypothetical protein ACJ8C4_05785 [Gemmataceae bacterium]